MLDKSSVKIRRKELYYFIRSNPIRRGGSEEAFLQHAQDLRRVGMDVSRAVRLEKSSMET